MTRKQAISEAERYADRLIAEARGVLRDAIDYRRDNPLRFALFHRRMAEHWAKRRRRVRERWHRYWEARYAAKAWALDQVMAQQCGVVP